MSLTIAEPPGLREALLTLPRHPLHPLHPRRGRRRRHHDLRVRAAHQGPGHFPVVIEEILQQLIGGLAYYLQGFNHPR